MCGNRIPFWNLHTLKCKENINLEYMNIKHEPVATRLMVDIKHQPDRVLVDIWYQTTTGMQFWLTFDIKHKLDRVLVDI